MDTTIMIGEKKRTDKEKIEENVGSKF